MQIGSAAYISSIALTALAAVATGLMLESRSLLWCAVVIGAYALHLLAIHFATGNAATGTAGAALRDDRKALDADRADVERLRVELKGKIAQTDEQFSLLRSMVQKRLRKSADSTAAGPGLAPEVHASPDESANRTRKAAPELDESGRPYSRW